MPYLFPLPDGRMVRVDDDTPPEEVKRVFMEDDRFKHLWREPEPEEEEPGFIRRSVIGPAVASASGFLTNTVGAGAGLISEATGSEAAADLSRGAFAATEGLRQGITGNPEEVSFTSGLERMSSGDFMGGAGEFGEAAVRGVSGMIGYASVPVIVAALAPEVAASATIATIGTIGLQSLGDMMALDPALQREGELDFNMSRDIAASAAMTAVNTIGLEMAGLRPTMLFGKEAEKKVARQAVAKAMDNTAKRLEAMTPRQRIMTSTAYQGGVSIPATAVTRWANGRAGEEDGLIGEYVDGFFGRAVGGAAMAYGGNFFKRMREKKVDAAEMELRAAIANLAEANQGLEETLRIKRIAETEKNFLEAERNAEADYAASSEALNVSAEDVLGLASERKIDTNDMSFKMMLRRMTGKEKLEDVDQAGIDRVYRFVKELDVQDKPTRLNMFSKEQWQAIASKVAEKYGGKKDKSIKSDELSGVVAEALGIDRAYMTESEYRMLGVRARQGLVEAGAVDKVGAQYHLSENLGANDGVHFKSFMDITRTLGRIPTMDEFRKISGIRNKEFYDRFTEKAKKLKLVKDKGDGIFAPVDSGHGVRKYEYKVEELKNHYVAVDPNTGETIVHPKTGEPIVYKSKKDAQRAVDAHNEHETVYYVENNGERVHEVPYDNAKDAEAAANRMIKEDPAYGRRTWRVYDSDGEYYAHDVFETRSEARERARAYNEGRRGGYSIESVQNKYSVVKEIPPPPKIVKRGSQYRVLEHSKVGDSVKSTKVLGYEKSAERAQDIVDEKLDMRRNLGSSAETLDYIRASRQRMAEKDLASKRGSIRASRESFYNDLQVMGEVRDIVNRELAKRGLPHVKAFFDRSEDQDGNRLDVAGTHRPGVIRLYLTAKELAGSPNEVAARILGSEALAHEVMHDLESSGIVSANESKILTRVAENARLSDSGKKRFKDSFKISDGDARGLETIADFLAHRVKDKDGNFHNPAVVSPEYRYNGRVYKSTNLKDMQDLNRAMHENGDPENVKVSRSEEMNPYFFDFEKRAYALGMLLTDRESFVDADASVGKVKSGKSAVARIKNKLKRTKKSIDSAKEKSSELNSMIENMLSSETISRRYKEGIKGEHPLLRGKNGEAMAANLGLSHKGQGELSSGKKSSDIQRLRNELNDILNGFEEEGRGRNPLGGKDTGSVLRFLRTREEIAADDAKAAEIEAEAIAKKTEGKEGSKEEEGSSKKKKTNQAERVKVEEEGLEKGESLEFARDGEPVVAVDEPGRGIGESLANSGIRESLFVEDPSVDTWPNGVPNSSDIILTDINGRPLPGVAVRFGGSDGKAGVLFSQPGNVADVYFDTTISPGRTVKTRVSGPTIHGEMKISDLSTDLRNSMSEKATALAKEYPALDGAFRRFASEVGNHSGNKLIGSAMDELIGSLDRSNVRHPGAGDIVGKLGIGEYRYGDGSGKFKGVFIDHSKIMGASESIENYPGVSEVFGKYDTAGAKSSSLSDMMHQVKHIGILDELIDAGIDGMEVSNDSGGRGYLIWNKDNISTGKGSRPSSMRSDFQIVGGDLAAHNTNIRANTKFKSWQEAVSDFTNRSDSVFNKKANDGFTHYFDSANSKTGEPLVYVVDETAPGNKKIVDIVSDGKYGEYHATHLADNTVPQYGPEAKASDVMIAHAAADEDLPMSIRSPIKLDPAFKETLTDIVKAVDDKVRHFGEYGDYRDRMSPRHVNAKEYWSFFKSVMQSPSDLYDYIAWRTGDHFRYIKKKSDRYREKIDPDMLASQTAHAYALLSDRGKMAMSTSFKYGPLSYNPETGDIIAKTFELRNGFGLSPYDTTSPYQGLTELFRPLSYDANGKYIGMELIDVWQDYRMAKRGERIMADGQAVPFSKEDIAAALKAGRENPIVLLVDENFNRFNEEYVKFLVNSEIIPEIMASAWLKYSDYVPFYQTLEGVDSQRAVSAAMEREFGPAGKKLSHSLMGKNPHMKYLGRDDGKMMPALESITKNFYAGYVAGLRNIAAKKAYAELSALGEAHTVKSAKYAHTKMLVKGDPVYVRFDDPLIAETMMGIYDGTNPMIAGMSKIGGILREGITRMPVFMIKNFERDASSAYVTAGDPNMKPFKDSLVSIGNNIKAMHEGKSLDARSLEFMELERRLAGGAGFDLGNIYEGSKGLERSIRYSRDTFRNPLVMMKRLWDLSGEISAVSESAAREAVYRNVVSRTGNPHDAAFRGMEVMNYTRKGASPTYRMITAITPFLNARVQGVDVLVRAGTGETSAIDMSRKAVRKMFLRRAFTLSGMAAAYGFAMGNNELYNSMAEEKRWSNFMIPVSKDTGILIPSPFEVGAALKLVEETVRTISGAQIPAELSRASQFIISTNMSLNWPQAVKPIIEATTGYDYFAGRSFLPAFREHGQYATNYNKNQLLAQATESLHMGNPSIIQHVIEGYTGTMGMWTLMMADYVGGKVGVIPENPSRGLIDTPLFRAFYSDSLGGGERQDFYRLKSNLDALMGAVSYYRQGQPERAKRIIERNRGLYATRRSIGHIDKQMSKVNKYIRVLYQSDLPAEEKAKRIRKYKLLIKQLASSAKEIEKKAKMRESGGIW